MKLLHDKVSPLIESQFPALYKEEGPLFVQFVKEYYSWLESTDNPLYHARHLLDYRDIDTTLDEFVPHFQDKYLSGTPVTHIQNQRDLIKHSHDLYQTKGTVESLRLLFQMLFNEDLTVYYPGDDILRASDGEWIVPRYLELSISDRTASFIEKDIVGNISGARAFVERVDRRTYRGRNVDLLFITNIRDNEAGGSFLYGEYISEDGVIADAPKVVGSLTRIDIATTGAGFNEGDLVDIISDRRGREGRARVTSIGNRTGEVNYTLVSGGYGYTATTANLYVSNTVLSILVPVGVTTAEKFPEFSTITQPLVNVSFSSANVTFQTGQFIHGINATSNVITSGFVLTANATANWLLISPHSTAKLGINTIVGPTDTGSFAVGEAVYQANASGNAAVGYIVSANGTFVNVDQRFGPFTTSTPLVGSTSGCVANTSNVVSYAFTANNFANNNITKIMVADTTGGATKGTVTDLTANATVVGATNTQIGIYGATNTFKGGQWARISSTLTNATAEVSVVSSGDPGSFKIGGITNTEIIAINTDIIGGNNASNNPYLGLFINATSYGLPSNTSIGFSSPIGAGLAKSQYTIGSILSLKETFPGSNNTAKPFVVEIQKNIAIYGKPSSIGCAIANVVGNYGVGEPVTQAVPRPSATLSVANVSGTFQYGTQELIKQVRADGNIVYGELYFTNITSNTGTAQVYVSNTSNTFNNTNTIIGLTSGVTANVSGVTTSTAYITARGVTTNASPTSISLNVLSFQDFVRGSNIVGGISGATANVTQLQSSGYDVLGNNANVDSPASVANGTILGVEVIDSGVFYEGDETVTIQRDGNPFTATGTAYVESTGLMEGFWRGDRGTLDSTKRIQDNEYYQEYSYEIQSGIDRLTYEAAVNSITHIAGTKMFSKYDKKTNVQNVIDTAPATHDSLVQLVMPFSYVPLPLIPTSPVVNGIFGLSTAMNAERLLVGQPNVGGSTLSNNASVSVYTLATGAYEGSFTLPSIGGGGQTFGHTIDAYGNTAVVGAPGVSSGANTYAGRVYIYDIPTRALIHTINNPTWIPLFPMFGYDVAIYGNRCIVGAPTHADTGQVYVFNVTTGAIVYTKPNPFPYYADRFGACVAINNTYFVVGAYLDDVNSAVDYNTNEGAVYVYRISDGALIHTIVGTTAGQSLGSSISISGDVLVVGSGGNMVTAAVAGRIDVYTLSTGVLQRTITNPGTGSWFGKQVRILNNTLMAAAGSVVYMFDVTTGDLVSTFTNPNIYDVSGADAFGGSRDGMYPGIIAAKPISLFGDYIAIPAPNEDDVSNANTAINNGVVYLYHTGPLNYWATVNSLEDGDILTQKNGAGTVVASGQFVELYPSIINNTNRISLSNTSGSFAATGNVFYGNTQLGTIQSIIRENY